MQRGETTKHCKEHRGTEQQRQGHRSSNASLSDKGRLRCQAVPSGAKRCHWILVPHRPASSRYFQIDMAWIGFRMVSNSFNQFHQSTAALSTQTVRHFELLLWHLRHWLHGVCIVAVAVPKASPWIPWARLQALGSSNSMGSGRRDNHRGNLKCWPLWRNPNAGNAGNVGNAGNAGNAADAVNAQLSEVDIRHVPWVVSLRSTPCCHVSPEELKGSNTTYRDGTRLRSSWMNGIASTEFKIELGKATSVEALVSSLQWIWTPKEITVRTRIRSERSADSELTVNDLRRYCIEASHQKNHQVPTWLSDAVPGWWWWWWWWWWWVMIIYIYIWVISSCDVKDASQNSQRFFYQCVWQVSGNWCIDWTAAGLSTQSPACS